MTNIGWIITAGLGLSAVSASPGALVELSTGDVLVGAIVEENEQKVVLNHPHLGLLTLERQLVRKITADPEMPSQEVKTAKADSSTPQPAQEATAEYPSNPATPATGDQSPGSDHGFFDHWKSTLDLGVSGEHGSARKHSLRVALRSRREVEDHRTRFTAAYHLGTDHNRRTRNEFQSSLRNDWLLPESPWFYFAQGQYQYDEFKDWQHRLSGDTGAGYHFLDQEPMKLSARTGPGASIELDGQRQGLRPEWMAGLEWEWTPATRHKVTFSNVFVHDLLTLDRYRNKSIAAWTIRLDQVYPIHLRFSVENEYDSSPLLGRTYNDLKYFGSLQWEF